MQHDGLLGCFQRFLAITLHTFGVQVHVPTGSSYSTGIWHWGSEIIYGMVSGTKSHTGTLSGPSGIVITTARWNGRPSCPRWLLIKSTNKGDVSDSSLLEFPDIHVSEARQGAKNPRTAWPYQGCREPRRTA